MLSSIYQLAYEQTILEENVWSAQRRSLCVLQHLFYNKEKVYIVLTANNIVFLLNEEAVRFENGYHVVISGCSLCSLVKLH